MTTHDSVAGISRHFTSDEIEALVITAVSLAWSDQGPYLIPDGGYLTRDGQRIAEDASFSEDSLDNAISLYCASLGEDNEGTWQAFTSTGTAGQTYHLKLDDVLASAEPSIRQLVPGAAFGLGAS